MGVLDQVIQMKKQGVSDEDIIGDLKKQRISPKEINDALKQAQIKNAVSDFETEGMEPSVMQEAEPMPTQQDYEPQTEEYAPAPQDEYAPQSVEYSAQEPVYTPGTQEEGYQYASGGVDTDTVMEIAGQIFSERIRKIQMNVDNNSEMNTLLQSKIENLSERLKKIETTIDKLQIAILERVGSYGQNLDGIRKEMSMMQDSFSKMISTPRAEIKKEKQEETSESAEKKTTRKKASKK